MAPVQLENRAQLTFSVSAEQVGSSEVEPSVVWVQETARIYLLFPAKPWVPRQP